MTPSRTIVVAGAGIAGLTTALALAAKGFRVSLFDQAERLEETGAGIQLSPNATRILIGLGLEEALRATAVAPEALVVRSAGSGRAIVRMPLAGAAEARYGAPYWMVHRADLQAALLAAATAHPDIVLTLGARIEDYAAHAHGITVQGRRGLDSIEEHGIGLIGADGLWSGLRARVGNHTKPAFARRSAWRALLPPEALPEPLRGPAIQLWLGRNAHLVHYPVRGGRMINVVAIARDFEEAQGWSRAAAARDVLARFSRWSWARPARQILSAPEQWLKWALYDAAPLRRWGEGPVTLVGDAAHPMLPLLAQGAAMAIEDAAVLAARLARTPRDVASAMRAYESARRERTARTQRASRRNDAVYHIGWPEAPVRNMAMRVMGGNRLLSRFDWLYGWRNEEKAK